MGLECPSQLVGVECLALPGAPSLLEGLECPSPPECPNLLERSECLSLLVRPDLECLKGCDLALHM